MRKSKILNQIVSNPIIIMLVLSLVFIVCNLYIAQRTWSYSSDDVSWQTILMTWHPFGGHRADLGSKDNFIVNAPIIWLIGRFFSPSRTLLFIEASLFAVINFTLFYVSGVYLMRRYRKNVTYISLLPFLWIASFGFNFSSLFLNTNWRNFEAGFSFALFALAIKVYVDKVDLIGSRTARILTIFTIFMVGLLIYSDPYFLYFSVAPVTFLFMVLFLLKRVSRSQIIAVLVSMMASLVVARVLERAMALAGLFTPQTGTYQFTGLGSLFHTLANVRTGLLTIFMANPSDIHGVGWMTFIALGNLLLVTLISARLLFGFYRRLRSTKPANDERSDILVVLTAFLSALCVWVIIANLAYKADNYRYMLIIVYAFALLMAMYLCFADTRKWLRRTLVGIVTIVIIANLANLFSLSGRAKTTVGNAYNFQLVNKLSKFGVTKSYASYWDGNINTYFSKGKIVFLPITCGNGITNRSYLLIDTSLFARPASKSAYIINALDASWPTCTMRQAIAQFGKPRHVLTVADSKVLIYNYDLGTKIRKL